MFAPLLGDEDGSHRRGRAADPYAILGAALRG